MRVSSYRKPFLIYDFATAPFLSFLAYEGKFDLLFYQCNDIKVFGVATGDFRFDTRKGATLLC
jgi:hypothetical protein